ncbi:MAG: SET domain-containing protein-lysine N-methyltransferase [Nanoarchaeota archaeon]|nr:SET domain-containing protein-lysine N-methyltransferase [Nanoarchaeota archaeon]
MNTYVKKIEGKGRGLFAAKTFEIGDLVLEDHVIAFLDPKLKEQFIHTPLCQYGLHWPEDRSGFALVAGPSLFLNHSYSPNVIYRKDFDNLLFRIECIKPIRRDEEIQFNYNGTPEDQSPLPFPWTFKIVP